MRCFPLYSQYLAASLLCLVAMTGRAGVPAMPPAAPAAVPDSAQMVRALNSVYGAHPHSRANHAKGILLQAQITPSPDAATVSRAPHFHGAPSQVMVRFSNFGGRPDITDNDALAFPYGMALKFKLANGHETDLVMHSFNGFPSATAADFVDFMTALGRSPIGAQHPTMLERYADSHPQAKAFLAMAKPAPASFASQPYFSVNAFQFTNAAGQRSYGRYRMVPEGPSHFIDGRLLAHVGSDYLSTDIRARLASGPVRMSLQLQLADSGDALDDPSVAWPAERRVITLGSVRIDSVVDLEALDEQALVFLPDELPDGIDVRDPMIKARTRAYVESFETRMRQ